MKKILIVFCFIVKLSTFSLAQSHKSDPVSLQTTLTHKTVSDAKDMMLTAIIVSHYTKVVVVPDEDLWGEVHGYGGFLSIEVQKKVNGQYDDYRLDAHLDPLPISHPDSLRTNDSKNWSINIAKLFNFVKGEYRVRSIGRLSHYNTLHDIYSDWFYFVCTQKIDAF